MVYIILKTHLKGLIVVASNSYRSVIHYKKGLEGRKKIKYIFFFKPGVQNVSYRSLFVSNIRKKLMAKELYNCYNLSSMLVSCIVIYSNFQITKKNVLKLKIKSLSTVLMYII